MSERSWTLFVCPVCSADSPSGRCADGHQPVKAIEVEVVELSRLEATEREVERLNYTIETMRRAANARASALEMAERQITQLEGRLADSVRLNYKGR